MRVLIVDDQEINRILPRTHLERIGVSVVEADEIMAAGFDDLLPKPIRRDSLLRALSLSRPD
jgi:CheY-like chemotaxis protein